MMILRAALLYLSMVLLMALFGIRINLTASMPRGFYQIDSSVQVQRGDIVSVCPTKNIADLALSRSYLLSGHCPAGSEPFVKKLIAIPGDELTITNKGVTVNGCFYPAPIQLHDTLGRALLTLAPLNTRFHSSGYWLLGTHDIKHSWDSRYFGSVSKKEITGRYHQIYLHNDFIFTCIQHSCKATVNAITKLVTYAIKECESTLTLIYKGLQHKMCCPPLPKISFANFFVTPLSQRPQSQPS